mmetsp:Transcript_13699/g.25096  ORF Transcript_13699/g.25096 Transcript_13699/m.25096 type:complete len:82 (+) Transcript_13699:424-669(+)
MIMSYFFILQTTTILLLTTISSTAILLLQYRFLYKSLKMEQVTTTTSVPREDFASINSSRWRTWQAAMIFSIRCSTHSRII